MLFLSLGRPFVDADCKHVDGIELRLDLFSQEDLKALRASESFPVMFTLRKASHGGKFAGSEEERERIILELLKLKPSYFDLECDMRETFLQSTLEAHPATKFILSYHNFEKTPDDLEAILRSMERFSPFGCKIAAMTLSVNDALRMLSFSKKHKQLSVICMGEKGEFARVLGKVVGNRIDYAFDGVEKTAPGQISASDLVDIYRYRSLNEATEMYGLIGNPVKQSWGHIYHNDVFSKKGWNAVYVKMALEAEELSSFFPLASAVGFKGLSVTMPLKEAVLPYICAMDVYARGSLSSNTLALDSLNIKGTNTDGRGALDAIEKKLPVKDRVLVILGAGGAARAIAYEAKRRGSKVWIANRTEAKAKELADFLECNWSSLSQIPLHYDILVNCSPVSIEMSRICPGAIAMDIVYFPKETDFLKSARRRGCAIIYGEEMFLNQAALQTHFWAPSR